MKRCAVIGSPIAHSLSPLIHRTAYRELGIDDEYSYDAFEVDEQGLPDFIAGLGSEWVGLSVTAPNKRRLLGFGSADEVVHALDAANTIIFSTDGNHLYNTDVTGIVSSLAGIGIDHASSCLLVGNGATARTALYAVSLMGVTRVVVMCRDIDRARRSLATLADALSVSIEYTTNMIRGETFDLLISTIPVRHSHNDADTLVGMCRAVFEVTYNYYPSTLNVIANQRGIPNADGIDLLVAQAVEQLRLMTGRTIEPDILVQACRHALVANKESR